MAQHKPAQDLAHSRRVHLFFETRTAIPHEQVFLICNPLLQLHTLGFEQCVDGRLITSTLELST